MGLETIILSFIVPWLAAISWVIWDMKGQQADQKNLLTIIDTKLNIMFRSDDPQERTEFHALNRKKQKL